VAVWTGMLEEYLRCRKTIITVYYDKPIVVSLHRRCLVSTSSSWRRRH